MAPRSNVLTVKHATVQLIPYLNPVCTDGVILFSVVVYLIYGSFTAWGILSGAIFVGSTACRWTITLGLTQCVRMCCAYCTEVDSLPSTEIDALSPGDNDSNLRAVSSPS